MATHYCINCPRCKRGCSICRRCVCSDKELEEMSKPFVAADFIQVARAAGDCFNIMSDPEMIAVLDEIADDKDDEQKPETD